MKEVFEVFAYLPMEFDWSGSLSVLNWIAWLFAFFAVISLIAVGAELAMRARQGDAVWVFTDKMITVILGILLISGSGSIASALI